VSLSLNPFFLHRLPISQYRWTSRPVSRGKHTSYGIFSSRLRYSRIASTTR